MSRFWILRRVCFLVGRFDKKMNAEQSALLEPTKTNFHDLLTWILKI